MTNIDPGWYRDPAAPDTQRYWDGEEWVGKPVGIDQTPPESPEPLPPPEPTPAPEPQTPLPPPPTPFGARPFSPEQAQKLLAGRVPANPGLRLVARLIDAAILIALNLVVNGWFLYQYVQEIAPAVRGVMADPTADPMTFITDRAGRLQWVIVIIAALIWFAYEVPGTVNTGQTLGKRIMGLQVVSIPMPKLRYSMVISRWSLMLLPVVCFPFGVIVSIVDSLWCLYDKPFRQCLHDKSAMTMVIAKQTSTEDVKGDANDLTDSR
ncbi:MAG TPA: RDD family protein [Candidatus Stackebrandtia excrementipullorum]|nr:RDD family protein [Candidatus Stackebrandtia excrementipullorum]